MQNTCRSNTILPLMLYLAGLLCLSACTPAPVGQDSEINTSVLEPDKLRLADLQVLAGAIAQYQDTRGELPANFAALVESGILGEVPMDPEGSNYDYSILGDTDYELCARFERNSSNAQPGDFWQHPAGLHCFRLNPVFGQF